MSYPRVIPRDLFNEANLLKCYGRLYINLEKGSFPDAEMVFLDESTDESFQVVQDDSSGGLTIANVKLVVRGEPIALMRPLNSREPWPLYAVNPQCNDEVEVFDDEGDFTPAMQQFLKGGQ
jgi:hypothetical protein